MTDEAESTSRPSDRVIIEHKDGRTFSVTRKVHASLYPDFKIVGDETDASFVVTGVPKPKAKRKRPAPKNAAPVSAPVAEPVAEDVPDAEPA